MGSPSWTVRSSHLMCTVTLEVGSTVLPMGAQAQFSNLLHGVDMGLGHLAPVLVDHTPKQ